jgi:esterase
MAVILYSKENGKGPAVLLLHGLFGMGSNLGALARSLQDRYRVFVVDLPDHGRSPWIEYAGIDAMADCLRQWMDDQGLPAASLVGHSLGGKVAMRLALDNPERVTSLVVADIAPVAYPPRHDLVFSALDAVVASRCNSRADAARVMAEYLQQEDLVQFLLLSLQRGDDGIYRWRFNLEGLRRSYSAVRESVQANQPYRGPVLFIKGGDSDYIQSQHRDVITALFPASSFKVMAGCGHWLHAEKPRLFNGIVGRFLDASSSGASGSAAQ